MINVDHSSCLALGGTFDPCYVLTLSLVPSQMQATTNKRNAALIQSFMADILSVPPERGIVKFVAIPEENFAVNGSTLFGEIERLEQQQLTGNSGVKRAMTDVRKSMPAFKSKNSIPKFDTEFAKKADQADGFDGKVEELRNAVMPAPLKPKSELSQIFEVSHPRSDDERPSTSHGTPSTPAGFDGLRLNGISKGDLEGSGTKTPFGRPKTVGGRPIHPSSEINPKVVRLKETQVLQVRNRHPQQHHPNQELDDTTSRIAHRKDQTRIPRQPAQISSSPHPQQIKVPIATPRFATRASEHSEAALDCHDFRDRGGEENPTAASRTRGQAGQGQQAEELLVCFQAVVCVLPLRFVHISLTVLALFPLN
jgi:hypothetical protein